MSLRPTTFGLLCLMIVLFFHFSATPRPTSPPHHVTHDDTESSNPDGSAPTLGAEVRPAYAFSGAPLARRSKRPQHLRVMFVGDSITEGMAPNHAQASRPLVPKEGSCSYRFTLLQLLEATGLVVTPVGPFSGHVGSRVTHLACQEKLRRFVSGTSDRHAAIWGISTPELLGPSDFQRKRQFARKYYFGKRSPHRHAADSDDTVTLVAEKQSQENKLAPLVTARLEREHLRRWAYVLEPHLVTVLIGTNDLSLGVTASVLVLDRLANAILALTFPSQIVDSNTIVKGDVRQPLLGCPKQRRAVGIATILPRSDTQVQPAVEEVNAWMSRIRVCKENHTAAAPAARRRQGSSTPACITCVLDSKQEGGSRLSVTNAVHLLAATAWCLPCVFVLNISDPQQIDGSTEYFYDGVHPNAAGDQRVGELMARTLTQTGALEYL